MVCSHRHQQVIHKYAWSTTHLLTLNYFYGSCTIYVRIHRYEDCYYSARAMVHSHRHQQVIHKDTWIAIPLVLQVLYESIGMRIVTVSGQWFI